VKLVISEQAIPRKANRPSLVRSWRPRAEEAPSLHTETWLLAPTGERLTQSGVIRGMGRSQAGG
jgi:hypothetical protein